ncbi:MAG: hypothetical protein GX958_00935 [Desulfitobacterium sp.]|nr:hypothetical protein [Desulfitobacterium sp.]
MKKGVLALLIALAMVLTGCGGENAKETSGSANSDSNVSAEVEVLSVEEAEEALIAELGGESLEFMVGLLREAKLGDATVYVFDRVGTNGGASTVDFVHSETGKVYFDSNDLLLDEFKKSKAKEEYLKEKYIDGNIYYISMKSINDPEEITWDAYIVNNAAYSDLDAAKGAVISEHLANHPILGLFGKFIDDVVEVTGQGLDPAEVVDVDGMENWIVNRITYNGAQIFFDDEENATEIFIDEQVEFLGVQIGYTFDEISAVLGLPESISEDPYFEDVYTMTYVFDDIAIDFYAESRDGKTASALVRKNYGW